MSCYLIVSDVCGAVATHRHNTPQEAVDHRTSLIDAADKMKQAFHGAYLIDMTYKIRTANSIITDGMMMDDLGIMTVKDQAILINEIGGLS